MILVETMLFENRIGLVQFLRLMTVGYLMPKPPLYKDSNGTILPIGGRIRGFMSFPMVYV